jgi:4'-phosphopantetheinyl transferase
MIAIHDVVLSAAPVDRLAPLLAPEERARAGRFRYGSDRDHFVAARAALRISLAAELGIGPAEVRLGETRHGKPLLRDFPDVCFNLSHSAGRCLIGICRGRNLGVDLERIVPDIDLDTIPALFLSVAEQRELAALQPEQRVAGFFRAWVRKEAYLKGCGDGLARGLQQFDVSLAPGVAARLWADRGDPEAPGRWVLAELRAPEGFAAALAVEGGRSDIVRRSFDWSRGLGSTPPVAHTPAIPARWGTVRAGHATIESSEGGKWA